MSESFQHEHAGDNWEEQSRTSHSDDQWHAHTGESPPQHEHGSKANPVGIILVALASVVFVVGLIIVVMIYFNQRVRALRVEHQERADFSSFVIDQDVRQQQNMGEYEWIDVENNVFRIPLDRAIEVTAQEYSAQR